MRSRLGILAAVVAAFLTGAIVLPAGAAPGDLRRSNNSGGNSVLVPQIPGTPCWRVGSQTFRPDGTPFSACSTTTTTAPTTTAAPTTTLAPTTTTVAPTTTAGPTTTTVTPPVGVQFLETFDSAASMDSFTWKLADGRDFFSQNGLSWQGDHSLTCGAPDTYRPLSGPNDGQPYAIPMKFDPVVHGQAYWCPNGGGHMMTSFNTGGYSHLDFSPDAPLINLAQVCFDVNATDLGHRKWLQVAIVPLAEFDANGGSLLYTHPGFTSGGGPAETWGLPIENGTALVSFTLGDIQAFGSLSGSAPAMFDGNYNKVDRLETCITSTGLVTQALPGGGTRTTDLGGAFPAGPVKVIFQDVSYNPDKAVGESGPVAPVPYTWHWDNIVIR